MKNVLFLALLVTLSGCVCENVKDVKMSENVCESIMNNQNSKWVNVLTLGIKNDGSEDISDIVNKATADNVLYFPCGIYKVAKPIYLKNSVFGAGYARYGKVAPDRTWFVSEIKTDKSDIGIFNITEKDRVTMENISIRCFSQECAVKVTLAAQNNLFFNKVGIFNVKGYGFHIDGKGSRPIFMDNITIHGAKDYPIPGVGISCNTADNRFSNVEIMGCRVGMYLSNNYNYGSNIHIWTGAMSGKDNGTWWRGTRSAVLDKGAMFSVSNFYPDTSFYALENKTSNCAFHISNIFYYEDGSTGGSPDFDGIFFKGAPGSIFQISGGELFLQEKGVKNGRTKSIYTPGNNISGVNLKNDIKICAENLFQLILDDTLPDYSVYYENKGLCKVGDIVTADKTGIVEAEVRNEKGAAYSLTFGRGADGKIITEFKSLNFLCEKNPPLEIRQKNDTVYSIYYKKTDDIPENIRFVTKNMSQKFRPLHYGVLRTGMNRPRYTEIIKL